MRILHRLSCPECTGKNRVKHLRMLAYGCPRMLVWCAGCDKFLGQVGDFSKKTARQASKKEIQEQRDG